MEQVGTQPELRGLVKWNGQLCIAKFKQAASFHNSCPNCHGEIGLYHGWLECYECGFAVLESDVARMNEQIREARESKRVAPMVSDKKA